jgi:outer membrane protein OmpA-like peptidoglycan-associated protein/outer membrane protein W
MKKILLVVTAVLFLFASTAIAESIKGKFGVTARGGATYMFDSEWTDQMTASWNAAYHGILEKDIKAGWGWTVGGGIMYGITDNLAVEFDVIYLQTKLEASGYMRDLERQTRTDRVFDIGKAQTVDFSLGAQWRFMPTSRFVPYVGAGVDVMWNHLSLDHSMFAGSVDADVDPTFGGHLSAGVDYFITPNIALNAEIRGLLSTKGDMTFQSPGSPEVEVAEYNPSNISAFLGIRFFFGGAKKASAPVEEMKAAPEAATTVEHKLIGQGRATLDVKFDFDKTFVKPIYYKEIEDVADVLKKYPDMKIVVEGHTDNIGGEKYNLNLSERRSNAIKDVMVKNFNIESGRITPKGFGYSRPIADNSTKEGRQLNRRVEAATVVYTIDK